MSVDLPAPARQAVTIAVQVRARPFGGFPCGHLPVALALESSRDRHGHRNAGAPAPVRGIWNYLTRMGLEQKDFFVDHDQ